MTLRPSTHEMTFDIAQGHARVTVVKNEFSQISKMSNRKTNGGMVIKLMHMHQLGPLYNSCYIKKYPESNGVTRVKGSNSPKMLILLHNT